MSAYPVGHREARSKSFLNPSKQALHLLISVSSNIPSNTELKYVQIWGGSPSPNSYRHTLTLRVCEVHKSLLNQTLVENMLYIAVTTIRWADPTSTASRPFGDKPTAEVDNNLPTFGLWRRLIHSHQDLSTFSVEGTSSPLKSSPDICVLSVCAPVVPEVTSTGL